MDIGVTWSFPLDPTVKCSKLTGLLYFTGVGDFSTTTNQIDWYRKFYDKHCNETNLVTLSDTLPFTFRLFLQYIYSGFVDLQGIPVDQQENLLDFGNKYGVEPQNFRVKCDASLLMQ